MKLYEQLNERTGRDRYRSNGDVVTDAVSTAIAGLIKASAFSAVLWGVYLLMVQ